MAHGQGHVQCEDDRHEYDDDNETGVALSTLFLDGAPDEHMHAQSKGKKVDAVGD